MNNVGPSEVVPENADDAYAMLDKMPAQLRTILKYAPYDYALKPFYDDFRRMKSAFTVEQIAQFFAQFMVADRALEARDLYGPSHPQARQDAA